jgi:hypothetical protein
MLFNRKREADDRFQTFGVLTTSSLIICRRRRIEFLCTHTKKITVVRGMSPTSVGKAVGWTGILCAL